MPVYVCARRAPVVKRGLGAVCGGRGDAAGVYLGLCLYCPFSRNSFELPCYPMVAWHAPVRGWPV